jgi:rod shape determining protein RodA
MRTSLTSLYVALFVISVLGISTIWSTAPQTATKQITAIALGIIMFVSISKIDLRSLASLKWFAYFGAVLLLLLTEVIGLSTRGSTRWIDFGFFNLQSSELAKPLLIFFLASFLDQSQKRLDIKEFVKIGLIMAVPIGLIFIEPDLGSALAISIITLGILWFSRLPKKYILMMFLLGITALPLAFGFLKPYQKARIETFINPFADPSGSGYNVIQAMIAVGSGEFLGKGVRQGTQSQLRFLPERHTDFAFASFSEEFGFLGVLMLLGCFWIVLDRLASVMYKLSYFGKLIVGGYLAWILGQTIINVGMNMGIMPVTGITLPFVSYGSSSTVALLMGLGMVRSAIENEQHSES